MSGARRTVGTYRRRALLALTAATAFVLGACGAPAALDSGAAPPSMTMTVGYTAIGAAYSDLYVCQDQGVFARNGLDVRLTLLNSSSQLIAALASNSIQIGAGVARSTAVAALGGIDLRYLALPLPAYYLEMWAAPGITSEDQVRGKRIGLSSPGSLGDAAVDTWLRDKGWSSQDVHKTFLKSTSAEVTALQTGAVDAIVTQPPTGTRTRAQGFHRVMDFTRYPTAANAYTAKSGYVASNRPAVEAFERSEVECLATLHQNRAATVASIRKHSGSDDLALAEYSYDFFEPLWARTPVVDPRLLQQSFDQAAADRGEGGSADAARYVDNSFLDDLERNGTIAALYAR